MSDDIELQWKELCEEYQKLEENHQRYLESLKDLTARQKDCLAQINHQRYRLNAFNRSKQNSANSERLKQIREESMKREAQLQLLEETLPRKGGLYLRIILGNFNVGFLSQDAKFQYKEEYEKFKLVCLIIAFVFILMNMSYSLRFFQKIYLLFLVWYYCTLTIRESVLRANGSGIKTWWRVHHGLSVFASIVLLVWPENSAWDEFKGQFFRYNLYNCLVQYLQFNYQRGTLYRLKALGKKTNMDITIEGFQFWMWRGLAFLYPFLFASYIYQLVNAYTLFNMYLYHRESSWHVLLTSIIMFIFFVGNSTTTLLVIPNKIKNQMLTNYKLMTRRLLSMPTVARKRSDEKLS